ncbi:MAG: thioredoxin-dependent thiol peroxidase [Bacteroidota bacterium]|nr:thioredoxin-dependent thiol peroxidase [Bacteroidota bacterium]
MKKLKVGDPAPIFSLPDAEGKTLSLSDFKGKKVIVYFYPKDDTPGCTKEACTFRDYFVRLERRGAAVVGISADTIESHHKFSEKYKLPFPLLSDESKEVIKTYGAWKKKWFMGKSFMGIERTTFIIDEEGKIAQIFPRVIVDKHIWEILKFINPNVEEV